jgi:poly(A)-specific ribonuclease
VLHHLLACCLLQVFQRNTSLAEVYSALVEDGQAGDTQALLAAASAAAGHPITLPHISHAAGFDKYRSLGAGEAAHEAGYDAYMTGAAFACLLPLVAGKIAAEPSSTLAQAHSAALERAAAAAAARAARAASMATPEVGALQQQTPPLSPMLQQLQPTPQQQQQQSLAEQQATPQLQQQTPQAQQLQPSSLLQYIQGIAGRLNITFSDIAYAALSEDDPVPERPTTFCLSGLQPGYRLDDVWRMLQRQGLGSVSGVLYKSWNMIVQADRLVLISDCMGRV